MLKFSKKVDYGLILLSKLRNEPSSASAREIAARYRLPLPMVANILKQLTSAGILVSTRGAQGGYELARDASRISLADVVRALDAPFSLVDCTSEHLSCRFAAFCPTHDPIQKVQRRFQEFMAAYKIEEIIGHTQATPFQLG
ncbi:MAG: Rrf2 family transcriptional regulator [SAR324 cluster bacterium]|nr:Rrf2 family transcriptional regulator [SAR324 cluster bacterium]